MSQPIAQLPLIRALVILILTGIGMVMTSLWVVDGSWVMAALVWGGVVGLALLPYPRLLAAVALAMTAAPVFLLRHNLIISNVATAGLLVTLALAYPRNRQIWRFNAVQFLIGLYMLNLVVIMFTRGFGLLVFGGEGAGAMSYIRLFLAGALVFGVIWYPIAERHWKWILIGLALGSFAPVFADICYAYNLGLEVVSRFLATSGLRPGEAYLSGLADWYFLRFVGAKETAIWVTVVLLALARPDRLFGLGVWRYLPWLVVIGVAALVSGYRICILTVCGLFAISAALSGQITVPRLVAGTMVGLVVLVLLYGFATELPLTMQRSISFLPGIEVSPVARTQALGSLDWRVEVWKGALPEVPKYLLVGKGFTFSVAAFLYGQIAQHDWALLNSTYHNGALSSLILTGLPGTVTLILLQLTMLVRHGRELSRPWVRPHLKNYHRAFYAYLIMEVFSFWVIYGDVAFSVVLLLRQVAFLEGILATEHYARVQAQAAGATAPAAEAGSGQAAAPLPPPLPVRPVLA